ncbi:hypothetical protein D9C73_010167 [Collichthys lucidus]|uniref:Uncharacterized protein n=1 Tax=Collichthys lucidus TaxID=240159 RepID=A0A4V6AQG2_COLLU|nr:hypothetical protein D9C73_010167 [Collichthys lucidus]
MDEMTGLNPAKQCAPSSAPEPPKKARKTLGRFFKAAKDREESDPAVTHEQAALLELESYPGAMEVCRVTTKVIGCFQKFKRKHKEHSLHSLCRLSMQYWEVKLW